MNCDGAATCGTGFFGTINTCGGGGASIQADRLTQQPGTNCGLYTGPTNPEIRVAQCCPHTTGPLGVPWFAEKACPTTNNLSTSCGTVPSGACKGCPTYPIDATQTCSTGTGSPVGTCGSSVYQADFSFTSYSGTVLTDSPLSYWRLGEASGATTAADATGAHAGTYYGASVGEVGAIVGDPNTAIRTHASESFVDIGDYYTFYGTAAFSLEGWFRPQSYNAAGHQLVSKINRSSGNGYYLGIQPSGLVVFDRVGAGGEAGSGSPSALPLNVYTHVVATYDGATMRLYVNGAEVNSRASTRSIGANTLPPADRRLLRRWVGVRRPDRRGGDLRDGAGGGSGPGALHRLQDAGAGRYAAVVLAPRRGDRRDDGRRRDGRSRRDVQRRRPGGSAARSRATRTRRSAPTLPRARTWASATTTPSPGRPPSRSKPGAARSALTPMVTCSCPRSTAAAATATTWGYQPSGYVVFVPAGAGGEDWLGSPSALPLNVYTHLVATYDGATMRLYVNGAQVSSLASTRQSARTRCPCGSVPSPTMGRRSTARSTRWPSTGRRSRQLGSRRTSTGEAVGIRRRRRAREPYATANGATAINLSWTASTDNVGVTGYKLERCQGSSCTNFVQIATPTGTSYPDWAHYAYDLQVSCAGD